MGALQTTGLASLLILCSLNGASAAGVTTNIVPDIAPGRALGTTVSTTVTSSGTVYTIDNGTRVGSTLFHSFAQFDLGSTDEADWTYTAGDPTTITNVINRVTGGTPSNLDGSISSVALSNANFYFINPAGIIFGGNGLSFIEVPNAVYFSTASELRFADGAKFSAATPTGSVLTSAAPAAFGFLGGEGNLTIDDPNLFFDISKRLVLSAANIEETASSTFSLALANYLVAVGNQAASVALSDPLSSGTLSGNLDLAGTTLGARLQIDAGQIDLTGILLLSEANTIVADSIILNGAGGNPSGLIGGQSGQILLQDGSIDITTRSLQLESSATFAAAPAVALCEFICPPPLPSGNITINAETVALSGDSQISTVQKGAENPGSSGNITINARSLSVNSGSSITTSTTSVGSAGTITISAETVGLSAGSISSSSDSSGAAGAIVIQANQIALSNSSEINTSSALGPAGDISIIMPKNGLLFFEGNDTVSAIVTNSGANTGGHITISEPFAIIMNGGEIQAIGPLSAANVTINAGAIIESTDQVNSIAVAGTLALDSQVVDVGAAVSSRDLFFGDPFSVVSGQCAAQHAGNEISQLATIAAGPNFLAPTTLPDNIHASITPKPGACGGTTSSAAYDTSSSADVPRSLQSAIGSPHQANDSWLPILLAQDQLRPRTGPNSAAPPVPPYATPHSNTEVTPPAPQRSLLQSGGEIQFSDVQVTSDKVPFVAPAVRRWQPEGFSDLSLAIRPGDNLNPNWVKEQFQRNGLIGAKVSVDRILQLVLLINRAYVQNGYVNTGLRPRTPLAAPGGVLVLDLIAGRVNPVNTSYQTPDVHWSKAGRLGLDDDYIRDRLPSTRSVPFNAFGLEHDFRLLAEDPAIRTANATLQPGSRPGDARLTVLVDPSQRFDLYVSVADSRSPSVGGYRASLGGSARNLIFGGDLLSGEFGATMGLLDATVDYTAPLIVPELAVDVRAEGDQAAVLDPSLRALNIRSKEATMEGGLSYILIQTPLMPAEVPNQWTPAESLTVGLRVAHRISQSYLLGLPFSFSPGAVNGYTRFTVLRGTLDLSRRNIDRVWRVSLTSSFGLEGTGSDVLGVAKPRQHFESALVIADFAQRLTADDLELKIHAAGQWSNSVLYSAERFPLGGADTVRGYRENLLLSDKGVLGSVELSCPVDLTDTPCGERARQVGTFRAAVFSDAGFGVDDVNPKPDLAWLASVGVSLTWTPISSVYAKVSYARKLIPVRVFGSRDLQDDGVNFLVTLHPIGLVDAMLEQ